MNKVKDWLRQRTNFMYQHLADYYKLGTPTTLIVNASVSEADLQTIPFTFNGVPLSEGKFNGKFYQGREVVLEGKSAGGRIVTGWKVTEDGITRQVEGLQYAFVMPSCHSMQINAITEIDTGIDETQVSVWTWQQADGMITLNGVTKGTPVRLYDASGMLVSQLSASGQQLQMPAPVRGLHILKVGNESIKIRE